MAIDARKQSGEARPEQPASDEPEAPLGMIFCPSCGQALDARNAEDVRHHAKPGHEPMDLKPS